MDNVSSYSSIPVGGMPQGSPTSSIVPGAPSDPSEKIKGIGGKEIEWATIAKGLKKLEAEHGPLALGSHSPLLKSMKNALLIGAGVGLLALQVPALFLSIPGAA